MSEKRGPSPEDIKGKEPSVESEGAVDVYDVSEPRPPQVAERRDAGAEEIEVSTAPAREGAREGARVEAAVEAEKVELKAPTELASRLYGTVEGGHYEWMDIPGHPSQKDYISSTLYRKLEDEIIMGEKRKMFAESTDKNVIILDKVLGSQKKVPPNPGSNTYQVYHEGFAYTHESFAKWTEELIKKGRVDAGVDNPELLRMFLRIYKNYKSGSDMNFILDNSSFNQSHKIRDENFDYRDFHKARVDALQDTGMYSGEQERYDTAGCMIRDLNTEFTDEYLRGFARGMPGIGSAARSIALVRKSFVQIGLFADRQEAALGKYDKVRDELERRFNPKIQKTLNDISEYKDDIRALILLVLRGRASKKQKTSLKNISSHDIRYPLYKLELFASDAQEIAKIKKEYEDLAA